MLKTTDGRTLMRIMKELELEEPFILNKSKGSLTFELDGSTSICNGHDGENIQVEIDDIWVKLVGGGNEIKIPNYDHTHLEFAIVNAAELLWFEWGMNM